MIEASGRIGPPTRQQMGHHIASKLRDARDDLVNQWQRSAPVRHFHIDDLLPSQWAQQIHEAFPPVREMTLKKSLRELKYVAAQMDLYDPLLEEIIYAFQEPVVVEAVGAITALQKLEPDPLLYAGGISAMTRGQYLNPHIDNSHDKFRARYRVLNLLYYTTPDWSLENGGNLELWPSGPKGKPLTIQSKFNRLAVMVTDRSSWHSVSSIRPDLVRQCVSNYYFSSLPVGDKEYFHVTSFRGRPEQPFRDVVLRTDIKLRTWLRKLFPMGVKDNPHFYRKPRERQD